MAELNQNVDILVELKSAVLNVDWEISDETLAELSQEVEKLQVEWAGEKVLLVYLQILGALCQYIGSSREKSHPGTFLLVKEVFDALENVVSSPDMDQAEKNKDVMGYADRYNKLKKEIASGNFTPGPPEEEDTKSTMDSLMDDDEDHATDTVFDSMLNAMVKGPNDELDEGAEPENEPDEPVKAPTPPARPPVQAAFNKADGTEVEPDRNEGEAFAEADELLDDFFADDDVPAPGVEHIVDDDEIFDLDELPGGEGEDEILDLTAEDSVVADDELVIELDGGSDEDDDSLAEMEETLDDFFGKDDADDDLLAPAEGDDSLIDEALGDFFDDDGAEPTISDEALDLELAGVDETEQGEGGTAVSEAVVPIVADNGEGDGDDDLGVDFAEPELTDKAPEVMIPVAEVVTESVLVDDLAEITTPDAGVDTSCIEKLQRLLLSVEWEVDDKLLQRLQEEVESLSVILQENYTACLHLNFIDAVIRYVGSEQADVISDSMTCLKSLTDSLEGLIDNSSDAALYAEGAGRSFVDWHELVVRDFDKRLAEVATDYPAEHSGELEAAAPVIEDAPPVLSVEMQEVRESILREVRELIVQELAEAKK